MAESTVAAARLAKKADGFPDEVHNESLSVADLTLLDQLEKIDGGKILGEGDVTAFKKLLAERWIYMNEARKLLASQVDLQVHYGTGMAAVTKLADDLMQNILADEKEKVAAERLKEVAEVRRKALDLKPLAERYAINP